MAVRIQLRRDTLTNWSTNNPILAEGEMGLEKDTGRWKVGNGLDVWNNLPYSNSIFSGPSVITDNSGNNALRITQIGTGNSLLVEDSANPDNSPFVIKNDGKVGIGTASPSSLLEVAGVGSFSGNLFAPTASVDTNTTQVATTEYVINQDYLKNSLASETYLTQVSASNTYLTQNSASSIYLTQASASTTYLTQNSASTTYLTTESASAIYAPLDSPELTGTPITPDPISATQIANKRYVDTVLINTQLNSYSLVLSDVGKLIEMRSTDPNNLTVPLESSVNFEIGTNIDVYQYSTGQTTIVAEPGVTLISSGGKLKLSSQYSAATLVKVGSDEWLVIGDLSL